MSQPIGSGYVPGIVSRAEAIWNQLDLDTRANLTWHRIRQQLQPAAKADGTDALAQAHLLACAASLAAAGALPGVCTDCGIQAAARLLMQYDERVHSRVHHVLGNAAAIAVGIMGHPGRPDDLPREQWLAATYMAAVVARTWHRNAIGEAHTTQPQTLPDRDVMPRERARASSPA